FLKVHYRPLQVFHTPELMCFVENPSERSIKRLIVRTSYFLLQSSESMSFIASPSVEKTNGNNLSRCSQAEQDQ
ncbi:MAG TPA: hypothetical protein VEP90_11645, partial [Methylomirabilota bacterium]|nr:hypothetical protein [Methylomirabilota bacterium]